LPKIQKLLFKKKRNIESQKDLVELILLREFIAKNSPYVSALSYLEVLGYHKLSDENKGYFEAFFNASQILLISQVVINQAVKLKQIKRDAIIAGTALVYELTVVTRNINDFRWINQLNVLNPFDN
jgi:predicted nucleic acid-binding protein